MFKKKKKIDDIAEYALVQGYLVADKSLPWSFIRFSVRSNQYHTHLHIFVKIWLVLYKK